MSGLYPFEDKKGPIRDQVNQLRHSRLHLVLVSISDGVLTVLLQSLQCTFRVCTC